MYHNVCCKITNCLNFFVHCTVYTLFPCTVYSYELFNPLECTVYYSPLQCTLCTLFTPFTQCTMYSIPLYNVLCTLFRIYPCTVDCVHYTPLFKMHCCVQGITLGHVWVTTEKCQLYKYDNVNICIHYFTTNS